MTSLYLWKILILKPETKIFLEAMKSIKFLYGVFQRYL